MTAKVLQWLAGDLIIAIGTWLIMSALGETAPGQYAVGFFFGSVITRWPPLVRWYRVRRYRRYLAAQQAKTIENGPYRTSDFTWVGAKLTHDERQEVIDRMNEFGTKPFFDGKKYTNSTGPK